MGGNRRLEYKVLQLTDGGWSVVIKPGNAPAEHWFGFSTVAQAQAWVRHEMLDRARRRAIATADESNRPRGRM